MSGHDRPFRWTVWVILIGALAMGATLVWQLYGLTPARWCVVPINAAKMAGARPIAEDCTTIVLRLLDLKDHAITGLLIVLGLSFVAMVVTLLGARINFNGPGGIGGSIGGRDEP
ncbi:hypothetical protein GG804_26055 [Sphingomonas histidinilytica]|uniref:hypothetical protein n=1 Tax=Rhizorhabdus histidinilytica TaxID=439228 RepID=UPI001ADD023A|nr:hypothetical protein [Rhizorhabdus histidinilytica]MBO9380233.1 hypothetical protein [Rhizorhabdus histidinilytica]